MHTQTTQGGDSAVPASKSTPVEATAPIEVIYYTDPLCSWSWAFEPQWRRLRYELGDQLQWIYRMGGMIADWQQFSDPLNDVSRPVQMGPQWYQVRTFSGMPFDERIWYEDPPGSSYPACVAYQAALMQGEACGESYLRRLREAVMCERQNIARRDRLLALAEEVGEANPNFDPVRFQQDLESDHPLNAFRADLMDARWRQIGRFPTLIVRSRAADRAILIMGYRPYDVLSNALIDLAPDLERQRTANDILDYVNHWGWVTQREIVELFDGDQAAADKAISAVADHLDSEEIPNTRHLRWHVKPAAPIDPRGN